MYLVSQPLNAALLVVVKLGPQNGCFAALAGRQFTLADFVVLLLLFIENLNLAKRFERANYFKLPTVVFKMLDQLSDCHWLSFAIFKWASFYHSFLIVCVHDSTKRDPIKTIFLSASRATF